MPCFSSEIAFFSKYHIFHVYPESNFPFVENAVSGELKRNQQEYLLSTFDCEQNIDAD